MIETHEGVDALVFKLEIEHADLVMVPSIIDTRITLAGTTQFGRRPRRAVGRYATRSITSSASPDILRPAIVGLTVTSALVKITAEALGLDLPAATSTALETRPPAGRGRSADPYRVAGARAQIARGLRGPGRDRGPRARRRLRARACVAPSQPWLRG